MQGTPREPGGELHASDREGQEEGAASWGNLLVAELEPREPVPHPTHTADWQPFRELCWWRVFIFSDAPDSFCGMLAGGKAATFTGLVKTPQVGGLSSSLGRVVSCHLEMSLYKPRCLSSWQGQPEQRQSLGKGWDAEGGWGSQERGGCEMTVWGSKESLCPAPLRASLKTQLWSLSLLPGLERSPQSGRTCLLLCPGNSRS